MGEVRTEMEDLEEKDCIEKFDAFIGEYYERCGLVATILKNISKVAAIVILISFFTIAVKDGEGFWFIVGNLIVNGMLCGTVMLAVTVLAELITRRLKK